MAQIKRKPVRFDAIVRFFMQRYDVMTMRDVKKLMTKMDRLEKLIKATGGITRRKKISPAATDERNTISD